MVFMKMLVTAHLCWKDKSIIRQTFSIELTKKKKRKEYKHKGNSRFWEDEAVLVKNRMKRRKEPNTVSWHRRRKHEDPANQTLLCSLKRLANGNWKGGRIENEEKRRGEKKKGGGWDNCTHKLTLGIRPKRDKDEGVVPSSLVQSVLITGRSLNHGGFFC